MGNRRGVGSSPPTLSPQKLLLLLPIFGLFWVIPSRAQALPLALCPRACPGWLGDHTGCKVHCMQGYHPAHCPNSLGDQNLLLSVPLSRLPPAGLGVGSPLLREARSLHSFNEKNVLI